LFHYDFFAVLRKTFNKKPFTEIASTTDLRLKYRSGFIKDAAGYIETVFPICADANLIKLKNPPCDAALEKNSSRTAEFLLPNRLPSTNSPLIQLYKSIRLIHDIFTAVSVSLRIDSKSCKMKSD
jgi:hypothetical protein